MRHGLLWDSKLQRQRSVRIWVLSKLVQCFRLGDQWRGGQLLGQNGSRLWYEMPTKMQCWLRNLGGHELQFGISYRRDLFEMRGGLVL